MYQIIKQAYLAYATISNDNPMLGPHMSAKEVELMLEECSILDGSNTEHLEYLSKCLINLGTGFISSTTGKHNLDKLAENLLTINVDINNKPNSPNQFSGTSAMITQKIKNPTKVIELNTIPYVCFSSFFDCVLRVAVISLDPK